MFTTERFKAIELPIDSYRYLPIATIEAKTISLRT